ncbi:hypothetical protein RND81_14G042500 [Saponaria officinalis]|uniref:non-specific serine/threonine protein kinase n=1 Tax=Saponaria officinalis TaxID=3572 RepID=A0AAW1GLQ9_SAPOF
MSFVQLTALFNLALVAILISSPLFASNHPFVRSTTLNIVSDKDALISFRSQLSLGGPSNPLSSWDQNSSPCNWTRVECDTLGRRVVGLDMSNLQIGGSISPQIGNISFLESLQLQNNHLIGTIPNEVCNLLNLKVLNLSSNNLEGVIPSNIIKLSELKLLDLTMNNVSGIIPSEIGSLQKLQVLNLAKNLISGPIPRSIGNISSLITLDLGTNKISGSIPTELSRLTKLNHLDLSINNLIGLVPPKIYNMSSLVVLALASNQLSGDLPYDVGKTLPNLLVFYFCINKFTGRIPGSLHNLTNIQVIRMAHNRLTGTIPPGLGHLPFLKMYNIGYNRIVSSGENGLDFINLLSNSTQLNFLAFDGNLIEGSIPNSIGNLSKVLSKLYMGSNHIHGTIPSTISQLTGLTLLNMSYNEISGPIPSQISLLQDLQVLDLSQNRISDTIPESLGTLTKLDHLDLSRNNLVGKIPKTFEGFRSLSYIDLSSNKLNGTIPKEIFNVPISDSLKLSDNLFHGELPKEIGLLINVVVIDLCNNRLSGNIPTAIANCESLVMLNMSRNNFSGIIPSSLGQLNALDILDLSKNRLSGIIPSELRLLNGTQSLNLSYNDLEGRLPCGGLFTNLSRVYLQGNPKISLKLACQDEGKKTRHTITKTGIIVIVVGALLMFFMIVGSILYIMRKRRSKVVVNHSDSSMGRCQMVKYDDLRHATDDFNERNLIGRGGFGSVFKGALRDNMVVVAIKVLDKTSASWKSFVAECEALRQVRHRNLVKLITSCTSLDFRNNEFAALVYEYMSNGSLEDWINGRKTNEDGNGLSFVQRLNVGIDVASALDYLHNDSEVGVVHCDLKPSNVLLDEDMTAKVGDFGLAKILLMEKSSDECSISSSHVLKGSIGYMPPEYGLGVRPSKAGDTYSFGVTLLEMFTGKSPTHEGFTSNNTTLVEWVKTCLLHDDHQVMDIVHDQELFKELESNNYNIPKQSEVVDYMFSIFEIGLSCTNENPNERIAIRDALHQLQVVQKRCSKSFGLSKYE